MSLRGTSKYQALLFAFKADEAEAKANIENYFSRSVGVAEHPNVIEDLKKLITQLSQAQENIKILEKEFG